MEIVNGTVYSDFNLDNLASGLSVCNPDVLATY
jgi:hypothetical protein